MKLTVLFIAVIHLVIAIAFIMCVLIEKYMPADLNVFIQAYIIIMASFIAAGAMVALINYVCHKWL